MYLGEIVISPPPADEECHDTVSNLVQRLHHEGRLVPKHNIWIVENDRMIVAGVAPDQGSLDKAGANKLVQKLKRQGHAVNFEIGPAVTDRCGVCSCEHRPFLIIEGAEDIPITCGGCGKQVPLYRLPYTDRNDQSFYDLDCWNKVNLAWGVLEFYSAHEQLAQTELADLQSALNQDGMEIRARLEEVTQIPCFLNLEDLREDRSACEIETAGCPSCSKPWHRETSLLDRFDFQCETCRLVSTYPRGIL